VYVSRREWLAGVGALALAPRAPASGVTQAPRGDALVPNKRGGCLILPGEPSSCFGAIAAPGFAVVRAVFRRRPGFSDGLARIEDHLSALGLSLRNLCGLELRSTRQFTAQEFEAFNRGFVERMDVAGLTIGGSIPIARTDVVESSGEEGQQVHAFSFTVPTPRRPPGEPPTFVLAGTSDVRFGVSGAPQVMAPGDMSLQGLRAKTGFILETVGARLRALGAAWSDVTGLQLYSLQDLHASVASLLLREMGDAGSRGIQVIQAQPPTARGEVALDVRSTHMELSL
jgi:hypothetical protein